MLRDVLRSVARFTPHKPIQGFLRVERVPVEVRRKSYTKIAKRLPITARWFDTTLSGHTLRLRPIGAGIEIYWTGQYEPDTLDAFYARARTARGVLDVGAHDGVFSLIAAASNPRSRVVAVEPDPASIAVATDNLKANSDLAVALEPIALSDREGSLPLYIAGGNSSLNPAFRPGSPRTDVRVERGDTVIDRLEIEHVDLIKIDTESTEPAVLAGLEKTIERDRPEIICEVLAGRTEDEIEAWVRETGYERFWLTDRGPVLVDRIAGDTTYRFVNYLFSHPDGMFRRSC